MVAPVPRDSGAVRARGGIFIGMGNEATLSPAIFLMGPPAAGFCADALGEMAEISRRGRIPLLVGGTMFYFRALEYGLSELPSADVEVRERLSAEGGSRGWPALQARGAAFAQ